MNNYFEIKKKILILLKDKKYSDPFIWEYIKSNSDKYINFLYDFIEIELFDLLIKEGFFDFKNNPQPKESENEKGYFSIPQWSVLPCLEKISEQIRDSKLTKKDADKYSKILICIIKDVTNKSKTDNWRTWWFFVKILSNLSLDIVNNEISNNEFEIFINTWLDSKFDPSNVAIDLARLLLPKLLKENITNKAWIIFKILTEIVPAKGMTNKQKRLADGFTTKLDSYWLQELIANKKIAIELGKRCSDQMVNEFMENINKMMTYKRNRSYNDLEKINIRVYLEFNDEDENRDIINVLIGNIDQEQKENKNYRSVFDDDFAKPKTLIVPVIKITNWKDKEKFISFLTNSILEIENSPEIITLADGLYDSLFYTHSYIWCPSIKNAPKKNNDDLKNVLIAILRDLLTGYLGSHHEEQSQVINRLIFNYKYDVFVRIGYYFLSQYFHKDIIDNIFNNYSENLFMEKPILRNESVLLINKILEKLPEYKEKIIKIIEDGIHYKEKTTVMDNRWKQRWYMTLKDVCDDFKKKYEEYKKISGSDETPINEDLIVEWKGHVSPVNAEDILQMTINNLVNYLQKFKSTDRWKPDYVGLANELEKAVIENPDLFLNNLEKFLAVYFIYIHNIIEGFKKAFYQGKIFDWQNVWNFLEKLTDINNSSFWENKNIIEGKTGIWKVTNSWLISDICLFISEFSKDERINFDDTNNTSILNIIKQIVEKIEPESYTKENGDYLTFALNTASGKLSQAIIDLAYSEKNTGLNLWNSNLKSIYTALLAKNILEAYIFLGESFVAFWQMDQEWLRVILSDTVKKKDTPLWEAFMHGYLFANPLYNDLWEIMKPHYEIAVDKNYDVDGQLIRHISLAKVRTAIDDEDADKLYSKILVKCDLEHINNLINFYFNQKEYLNEDDSNNTEDQKKQRNNFRNVVQELWNMILEKNKNPQTNEEKILASNSVKLIAGFNEIDEKLFKQLEKVIKYIPFNYNSPVFIELLNEYKSKGNFWKYMPDIYLEILKNYTPDFDKEQIKETISFLYEKNIRENNGDAGYKKKLDDICNKFSERGDEFLEDVWKKNK